MKLWRELTDEEKKIVEHELVEAIHKGRAAVDHVGGPPMLFDPRNNHMGWEHSEWRSLDAEGRNEAASQWFQQRDNWGK